MSNSFAEFHRGTEQRMYWQQFFFTYSSEEDPRKDSGDFKQPDPGKARDFILNTKIRKGDGGYPVLQWNYRAIFNPGGEKTCYQTSGRVVVEIIQVSEKLTANNENYTESVSLTGLNVEESSDDGKKFRKTIDALDSPVFAINKAGVVIAWNKAMERFDRF